MAMVMRDARGHCGEVDPPNLGLRSEVRCLLTAFAIDLIAGSACQPCARGRFYPYLGISTAIVMRDTQVSSPASLVSSICQTWVLRPM